MNYLTLIFNYLSIAAGIILGFLLFALCIKHKKHNKAYLVENNITENFKNKRNENTDNENADECEPIEFDDGTDNNVIEEKDKEDKEEQKDETEEQTTNILKQKIVQDVVSYSDISSCFSNDSENYIANNREKEDESYNIIKRKMQDKT